MTITNTAPFTYSIASILDLDSKDNFLATQVWPSARVAAQALLQYNPHDSCGHFKTDVAQASRSKRKLCEFGCGPGLPSLAAAHTNHYSQVVATDVDQFCLELVQAAAEDQGLENIVRTQVLDLTKDPMDLLDNYTMLDAERSVDAPSHYDWMKEIDLFVMADIFENAQVAKGAAAWTKFLLRDLDSKGSDQQGNDDLPKKKKKKNNSREKSTAKQEMEDLEPRKWKPRIWVFAQSDRAQREIYLETLREIYGKEADDLNWLPLDEYDENNFLWLVDLDETRVQYG